MILRQRVARLADIPEGTGLQVEVGGHTIALFRRGATVHALGNACPHMGAPLSDGYVEGGTVVCPWHGWVFDLKTGVSTFDDDAGVPVYRASVEGDAVFVEVAAADCRARVVGGEDLDPS
jgi:nitrite reductase/ring-hydroxylating ferredoxin subunit